MRCSLKKHCTRAAAAIGAILALAGLANAQTITPPCGEPLAYDGSVPPNPVMPPVTVFGMLDNTDRYDWWCFDVTMGVDVTVRVRRIGGTGNLNLGVLQGTAANGTDYCTLLPFLLQTNNCSTPGTQVTFTPTFTGTVTILVSRCNDPQSLTYQLDQMGGTLPLTPCGTVNNHPSCDIAPPGPFFVLTGQNVSFTVTGDDVDGDDVTLSSGALPAGATMTPALPITGAPPQSSTFDWTPGPGQGGQHMVDFFVMDEHGAETMCCVEINVNEPPIPSGFPPGNMIVIDPCAPELLHLVLQFASPEAGQITTVVIADPDGIQARGAIITNVPGNTAMVTIDWAPNFMTDIGTYVVTFTATDDGMPAGVTVTSLTIVVECPVLPERIDATQKGSLLIYPKVELCWSPTGALLQDTFIDIANDFPGDVLVQMFFVNGDRRILSPFGTVIEPGWNNVDNLIQLTANEPTYWSAATGLPKGVSPFSVLDPGSPPGRPVHVNGVLTKYVLRGFIIAFAVDELGREIRWNHLKGDAVIVNYADSSAWEYNAYASPVLIGAVPNGGLTGTPGEINLNGIEYARGFDQLLLDFYAIGSGALSGPSRLVTVNTDLTLHPIDTDLRQETDGPITTKASFDIWNMNEVKFSGTDLCITCWDQRLLSEYGLPNHFFLNNLQTDKGRARIDGLASILCPAPSQGGVAGGPSSNGSSNASLLGVVAKELTFDGVLSDRAGTNLHGVGQQAAVIKFDFNAYPPAESAAVTKRQGRGGERPNPPRRGNRKR